MRNVTVICYLFSLISFGMGYLKMLVFENAITEHINTFDYTIDLSLAISFFVLTIFLALIGFAFYYAKEEVNRGAAKVRNYDSFNLLSCEKNNERIDLSNRSKGNGTYN